MVPETVFLSWRWAEGAENLPRLQARRCGHLSRLVTARALLYPNSDAAVFPFQNCFLHSRVSCTTVATAWRRQRAGLVVVDWNLHARDRGLGVDHHILLPYPRRRLGGR